MKPRSLGLELSGAFGQHGHVSAPSPAARVLTDGGPSSARFGSPVPKSPVHGHRGEVAAAAPAGCDVSHLKQSNWRRWRLLVLITATAAPSCHGFGGDLLVDAFLAVAEVAAPVAGCSAVSPDIILRGLAQSPALQALATIS